MRLLMASRWPSDAIVGEARLRADRQESKMAAASAGRFASRRNTIGAAYKKIIGLFELFSLKIISFNVLNHFDYK